MEFVYKCYCASQFKIIIVLIYNTIIPNNTNNIKAKTECVDMEMHAHTLFIHALRICCCCLLVGKSCHFIAGAVASLKTMMIIPRCVWLLLLLFVRTIGHTTRIHRHAEGQIQTSIGSTHAAQHQVDGFNALNIIAIGNRIPLTMYIDDRANPSYVHNERTCQLYVDRRHSLVRPLTNAAHDHGETRAHTCGSDASKCTIIDHNCDAQRANTHTDMYACTRAAHRMRLYWCRPMIQTRRQ